MNNAHLTIILYHGVTDFKSKGIENISGKHLDVDEYFDQMKWLKRNTNILSMEEVFYILSNNKSFPKNAIAITFDDGFENNYSKAFPILKNLEIPTTFYISSAMIGSNKMFWVDKLEDCINNAKSKTINMILEKEYNFELKNSEDKINALTKIKSFCKMSKNSLKEKVIEQLIAQTGHKPDSSNSDNYKVMSWQQLKEMSLNEYVIIGGHSSSHEILSKLDVDEMQKIVKSSIDKLSSELNIKIEHYSYPEGQHDHYNQEVINALISNGIKCCPSAIHGVNYQGDDPFHLKRIMVGFAKTPFPEDLIKSSN